jgi:hypothetical protein
MKSTLLILVLLSSFCCFGQINVGSNEIVMMKPGTLEQDDLESLKRSKTLFVYRDTDKKNLEFLKTTLNQVWDYSELELIPYEEYVANNYGEDYSFFTISGVHRVKTSENSSGGLRATEISYVYLTLWMKKDGEKLTFCRIELFTRIPPADKPLRMKQDDHEKRFNLLIGSLYQRGAIYNWYPGYLKNAFQFVNKKLNESSVYYLYAKIVSSPISKLNGDTLYIPEYALLKDLYVDEKRYADAVKKVFKKYPYPYKLIPDAQLSTMITSASEPFYYLSFIMSGSQKMVSVINGVSGDPIYSSQPGVLSFSFSVTLNSKDLASVAKSIKSGK